MLASENRYSQQHVVTYLLDSEGLLLLVRSLQGLPGIFGRDVAYNTIQGEETVDIAVSSDVALGLADTTALGRLVRAVGLAMTRLATAAALASELALNPLIRAVGGVVARLIAVVAQSRVGAFLTLLGAVASEMVFGATAAKEKGQ